MTGRVWGGDQRGPGRHNLFDVTALGAQLALQDHPGLATVDEYLAGQDGYIPRTETPAEMAARLGIPAPLVPRERARAVSLGNAALGVVNPPSTRIRRCGEGAQFAGDLRTGDKPDPLREALGAEYFEPEPELENPKPEVHRGQAKPVSIGELARRLERKADSIRNWIDQGIIPDAPLRSPGKATFTGGLGIATTSAKRLWPAAEADELVRIAAQERILSKPRQPIGSTNFSQRAWDARTKQQMRDDEGAK